LFENEFEWGREREARRLAPLRQRLAVMSSRQGLALAALECESLSRQLALDSFFEDSTELVVVDEASALDEILRLPRGNETRVTG
jgi:hypothetical protein